MTIKSLVPIRNYDEDTGIFEGFFWPLPHTGNAEIYPIGAVRGFAVSRVLLF